MLPAQQTGQDGVGQKYVLTKLPSVRLKSKPVTAIRSTTLKIEGTMSGATYTMAVTVKPGDAVLEFYPPPVDPDPPSGPVASFTHQIIDLEF